MPHFAPVMESRQAVFQTLKPACVALSQATLMLQSGNSGDGAVVVALASVLNALQPVTNQPHTLDVKLADYVFFPLSQVLKASQKLSVRSLELSLQCLQILVQEGWREQITPQLAAQLLILLTFMADDKPNGLPTKDSTDELQVSAFRCLSALLIALGGSVEGKKTLIASPNMPSLGHAITVILDGIDKGTSTDVQVKASNALAALTACIDDVEVLASFLPGIASRLTKILTPRSSRRNYRVLVVCLDVLTNLLRSTLNDTVVARYSGNTDTALTAKSAASNTTKVDAAWLKTTSTQLYSALANIQRLRNHSRLDVTEALARLCVTTLQQCRSSLDNCSKLVLETLITLSPDLASSGSDNVIMLVTRSDESVTGLLQSILYDWLTGLTTVMQGGDETAKVARMRQINTAYGVLVDYGSDLSLIDRMLATALRDSVAVTLSVPRKKVEGSVFASPMQVMDIAVLGGNSSSTTFSNALAKYKAQEGVLDSIETFAANIGRRSSASAYTADLARSLRTSTGDAKVASFWLMLTAVRSTLQPRDDVDALMNIDRADSSDGDNLENLYSFALDTLADTDSDETQDPRLVALALQTLALQANFSGQDFRYELLDALYPVLHTLATPVENLQHDAMACLNVLVSACNYVDVRQLIVENVDYLTNAVALKLNAFDVSPQAPQVLLVMVRLAGPSLLPYLEDTIASIFAALEDYHGYPLLVELLFKVLGVIAEEGVKAPLLAIENEKKKVEHHLKECWQPASIADLADLLRADVGRGAELQNDESTRADKEQTTFPRSPWNAVEEAAAARDEPTQEAEADRDEKEDDRLSDDIPPPPAPKTFALLLKITELTQHYLSSASPSLRTALLSLIRTTVPAIAKHENSFLPLINTLWPEIVSRLDEPEEHVQATALDIVAVLCEHAGDFMRSRISALWPGLLDMHEKLLRDIQGASYNGSKAMAKQAAQSSIARLTRDISNVHDTVTRQLWNALINCLATIVEHVPISAAMFDETLIMMEPMLGDDHILQILEQENADAVWLARLRAGMISLPETPKPDAGEGWKFAMVSR